MMFTASNRPAACSSEPRLFDSTSTGSTLARLRTILFLLANATKKEPNRSLGHTHGLVLLLAARGPASGSVALQAYRSRTQRWRWLTDVWLSSRALPRSQFPETSIWWYRLPARQQNVCVWWVQIAKNTAR
jgi:hypothetical protein